MGIFEEAYQRLYPGRTSDYNVIIKYSGKFSAYNANARMRGRDIIFSLSRKWKGVDEEIRIGLLQELLLSLLKDKRNTLNTELYNNFIRNVHLSVEKTESDPVLDGSYERVDGAFFNGVVEKPNLAWGKPRRNTWGTYNYNGDRIVFNPLLKRDLEALDYVMYHELLHKRLKFKHSLGRSYHHTSEFRTMEKSYPNSEQIEKRLKRMVWF
jgi:hypothetical protein